MELVPGIHRIEGVRGAASFLAISGPAAAVIDTGIPGNEKRIVAYATKVGFAPRQLRYIVVTHPDLDHSGSVAKLKALTGAQVAIHGADAPRLSGEKKLKETKGAPGILLGVLETFVRFAPVNPDLVLKDSDRVLDLLVVHTPGHTDGSICLYREGQAMFVGDALGTDSSGRFRLPPRSLSVDMDQAKESIRRIASFNYELILPGHGPSITKNGSASLDAFVKNGFR